MRPSPLDDVREIEELIDEFSEAVTVQATSPQITPPDARGASPPSLEESIESPIARRQEETSSTSEAGVSSRVSQKRGHEEPVHETMKKKPLLRFRRLPVRKQLFESTPLVREFACLEVDRSPDDEEPISIRSASDGDCSRSFFLSHRASPSPPASPPSSYNSHVCERSHGISKSELRQTQ